MEAAEDPGEESYTFVMSENQEPQNMVSTQETEEDPVLEVREEAHEEVREEAHEEVHEEAHEEVHEEAHEEVHEEAHEEVREEAHEEVHEEVREEAHEEVHEEESEKLFAPQTMIDLQRELTTSVTNIQTAADAKESKRRIALEEARRIRLERLENDDKSSQERFQEITRGWSTAKQKVIPQELQEALNKQQRLCAALIEDKKKLISDLQQELKAGDDRFVKDLRKQEEELDLMMERMENQIKTLTKAYREELAQILRVYQQESDVLLTKDKTKWEQLMKQLWDEELERETQRKNKVKENEAIVHNLMMESINCAFNTQKNVKFQFLERDRQQIKARRVITNLKLVKPNEELAEHRVNLNRMKKRNGRLQTEMKTLGAKSSVQNKQFTVKNQRLSEEYKRSIQQYEHIQKKIRHFAVADARQFEEMWLTVEAEVKQLVERALAIDSLICQQHLGLAWARPPMGFMELSGPIRPQKQARRPAASPLSHAGSASQRGQRVVDLSVGPGPESDTESTDMEMHGEGRTGQRGAEVEEGKLSMETVKQVMELLCDEAGFLMEDKLLSLLASLEKEEQTVVKLGSILCAFGIEEEDVPKLAEFLLKYEPQQRGQPEVRRGRDQDVCVESDESSIKETRSHLTSDLVNPNHMLPALKGFLEQHVRSRESAASQRHSFHVEARDASEDEAYWDTMGNIISDGKVKLWEAAEITLKQYLAVLTEISELGPETQSLEQQNTELRMLLQQYMN